MSYEHSFRGNRNGTGSYVQSGNNSSSSAFNSHNNPSNRAGSIYRLALAIAAFFVGVYYFTSNDFSISTTANNALGKANSAASNSNKAIDKLKPDGQLCQPDDAFRYFLSSTQTQARCIDGSRPAFYIRKGHGDGKNKWFVFFEGGGWCFDMK
jgi:hypothetical protein